MYKPEKWPEKLQFYQDRSQGNHNFQFSNKYFKKLIILRTKLLCLLPTLLLLYSIIFSTDYNEIGYVKWSGPSFRYTFHVMCTRASTKCEYNTYRYYWSLPEITVHPWHYLYGFLIKRMKPSLFTGHYVKHYTVALCCGVSGIYLFIQTCKVTLKSNFDPHRVYLLITPSYLLSWLVLK